jgi:thiol:disulfide interchange protein
VRRRLRDSGIVLVRADWTKHDEGIASALTELGRSGVPTYVFYLPGQPAITLPEVLTPGIVLGRSTSSRIALRRNRRPG